MTIVSPPRGRTAAAVHEHRPAQRSTPVSGGRWVTRNCEAVPDHLRGNPRQRLACRRKPGRNPAQRRSRTGCSSSGSGGWNGSASSYRGCKTGYPGRSGHRRPGAARVRECWPVEAGDCGWPAARSVARVVDSRRPQRREEPDMGRPLRGRACR